MTCRFCEGTRRMVMLRLTQWKQTTQRFQSLRAAMQAGRPPVARREDEVVERSRSLQQRSAVDGPA
jgi:hypothetical protein